MIFRRLSLILIGLGLVALTACKREVDVSAPTAEVLNFEPAPQAGLICGEAAPQVFFLASGQTLEMEFLFRDNEALSQYKIDIHSNFDCHGHARKTEDWSVLEIYDLSGTEQTVSRSLQVPTDVTAGAYHFQVQVIDAAGNEDPLANYYDLRVVNTIDTIAPTLAVNQPNQTDLSVAREDSLRFTGVVTDNYSLGEGGNGRLLLTYQSADGGNLLEAAEIRWPESQGDQANFDFAFAIPRTLVTGDYEFVLSAYDGVNNESERVRYAVRVTE